MPNYHHNLYITDIRAILLYQKIILYKKCTFVVKNIENFVELHKIILTFKNLCALRKHFLMSHHHIDKTFRHFDTLILKTLK